MVDVLYGHRITSNDDRYLKLVDVFNEFGSLARHTSLVLMDYIPLRTSSSLRYLYLLIHVSVKHLPAWFPGAGFRKTAAAWRKTLDEMCDKPHEWVKQQIVSRFIIRS